MNDADLYSGIDNDPGQFGNEVRDEAVAQKILDQERQIRELTPKIEELLAIIDAEIASVMSIDRFLTASNSSEVNIRAELQAAALYKQYLTTLKTKFTLALQEAKK